MRNTQFGVLSLTVYAVLYTLRIYRHSGVDRKDKLLLFVRCVYININKKVELFFLPFCTMCFLRNICISNIYPHSEIKSQRVRQHVPEKGMIYFPTKSTHITYVCKFYLFESYDSRILTLESHIVFDRNCEIRNNS